MLVTIDKTSNETPVDLFEAKRHLRVEHSFDDEYIQQLLHSATAYAAAITNRALCPSEATVILPTANGVVWLPYGNCKLLSVQSNGLDTNAYTVAGDKMLFHTVHHNVVIKFKCGYSEDDCPADIKHALLMLVGTMYEQRADITIGVQTFKSHFASHQLLERHRI
ncbi:phage gp6-like head-tail connector protein [Vibrio cholerae]|uniref:head-tail connector protein n=1 Tax=Vibrio cholerae TaxID=666 RepID=UPI001E5002A3|nr:head-tail connector protein [Vibrio cholerae]EJL6830115.1 phage gp6-like head-tail connector protein [Vibrio cholerae]EJL7007698.1 phage gp6-like head-tail connector protein [Vibrio cholerae]EKF9698721.1 phage gp6-like head-tail connector protein [Vibrio cholerae]ELS9243381.1 phage gp6-like head-tail connector protein [Vibrio cholerae]MCD1217620.1 phage gp6-like head-tail connector protein [Vibrio cholerae]